MRYLIRPTILAFVFFALLSAITLSPLSYHLNSMAPTEYNGEYDYYHFHWNLWWVRHAVLNGENPFYTDMVLAPFTNNLSYHSLTPVLLPEGEPEIYRIPIGDSGDEGFIGHGWYRHEELGGVSARWAGGLNEALLYASVPPGTDYTLTIRAVAFEEPRTIKVVANAVRLGNIRVQPGDWQEYSLTVPADLVEQVGGNLIISLSAVKLISAADVGLSADTRPLSLAYDWVQFEAGAAE